MDTLYGEWVECKNCIYVEDCDTREDKDGCFLGATCKEDVMLSDITCTESDISKTIFLTCEEAEKEGRRMSELISREEAIRAIEDIVAVGTFVEGMKEKCLRAIKDVPVIDSDYTDRDITLYSDKDGMTVEEAINNIKEIQGIITDVIPCCDPDDNWGRYIITLNTAVKSLEKQVPKKPIFWENKYYFSPSPNDDWGYECPCCGNQDIDYPDHHCECGQALDWSDTE